MRFRNICGHCVPENSRLVKKYFGFFVVFFRIASKIISVGSDDCIIDGVWVKSSERLNDHPVYLSDARMIYYEKGSWNIVIEQVLIAHSISLGMHPLSTHKGEWFIDIYDKYMDLFEFKVDFEQGPFLMEDLGEDFFLRKSLTRVIEYIDPNTKEIQHSGAKRKYGSNGKRFCGICNSSFSANNFVSQHMKHTHKLKKTCYTYMDILNAIVTL